MMDVANAMLALPIVLAGERGFFHMPTFEDVRLQHISREANEDGWPFGVDQGYLTCVWVARQRVTSFVAEPDAETGDDESRPRQVVLSVNPWDLAVLNIAQRDLFASFDSLEQLVGRVAPYVTIARRLCDQPPGTLVGPGEL